MAAGDVPVLTIAIDDAQYRAFEERVRQFRASEDAAPGPWGDIAVQVAAIQKKFEDMAASLGEQADATEKTRDGIGIWGKGAEAAAASWGFVHLSARRFTTTLAGATRDLVRWERAAVTVSALLGAGSLFGIDALARAASNRRRQSSGLGVSTGELAAFQVSYGRLGDTDGLAQGFNRASTDVLARQPLQSLGVDARGKNFAQLFAETLLHVKDLVDRTDPRLLGPTLGAYHLDELGFSETVLRTIRGMSRAEIGDMQRGARDSRALFDIPDDTGRKFQDLITQLEIAGGRVQTALAGDLVNIAPGVTHVSESLVRVIDAMLDRPEVGTWLKRAGDGIEGLANSIGSRDAQDALNKAVDRFKMSREDFAKLEAWFSGNQTEIKRFGQALVMMRAGAVFGPEGALLGGVLGASGWAPTHLEGAPGYRQDDHGDQYRAGAAAERRTLAERNAERRGLGLPEYKTQEEYDRAEPAATGSTEQKVSPALPGDVKPLKTINLFGRPPDTADVDQRLVTATAAAGAELPPGYTAEVKEGYNPSGHVPGSMHHKKGQGALDIQIRGPDGKLIPDEGAEPQSGIYHRYARLVYGEVLRRYGPELAAKYAWGGQFGASRTNSQQDLMHHDFGGPRGRYLENNPQRMGPMPEQLARAAPPEHVRVSGRAGLVARMGTHPNDRPPPPPAVHVTNDADAQVTVHH